MFGIVGTEGPLKRPLVSSIPNVLSQTVVLVAVGWIWGLLGYEIGWLFPTIVGCWHIWMLSVPSRSETLLKLNTMNFLSGLFGCILYGIILFFSKT